MLAEGKELFWHCANSYNLYKNNLLPYLRALHKKYLRGAYNSEQAIKGFYVIACTGAKEYAVKYANGKEWFRIFNIYARRQCAKELEQFFFNDIEEGV